VPPVASEVEMPTGILLSPSDRIVESGAKSARSDYGWKMANRNGNARSRPRTMYLLNRATKSLMKRLEQALSDENMSAKQYTVLSIVRDREPISSSELSRRFFVTPQSMNEIVAGLEKAEFLSRAEDPSNRRILRIRLTHAGRRLLVKCDAIVDQFEAQYFGFLPKTQLGDFRSVLGAIVDDMREELPQDI
jgi:DNA-binding MarR family transcriptional regulator